MLGRLSVRVNDPRSIGSGAADRLVRRVAAAFNERPRAAPRPVVDAALHRLDEGPSSPRHGRSRRASSISREMACVARLRVDQVELDDLVRRNPREDPTAAVLQRVDVARRGHDFESSPELHRRNLDDLACVRSSNGADDSRVGALPATITSAVRTAQPLAERCAAPDAHDAVPCHHRADPAATGSSLPLTRFTRRRRHVVLEQPCHHDLGLVPAFVAELQPLPHGTERLRVALDHQPCRAAHTDLPSC